MKRKRKFVAAPRQSAVFPRKPVSGALPRRRYLLKIMNPDSPVIEIKNLTRRYGKHDAVTA